MTEILSNFHFIRPAALLMLPPVIALWWLWQRRSDPLRGWREQIDAELLAMLVTGGGTSRRNPRVVLLGAWLLAVVAIAGPTWRLEPSPFADDATPLMILLKADASMDNPDPAPSRMERARLKIADLSEARKGQPLGLIAYAGSAHLVLPPTRDTDAVAGMAAEIGPEIMPEPGDRPDLAVRKAAEVLGNQQASLAFLTDSIPAGSAALASAIRDSGLEVYFLSINSPDSISDKSLRKNAGSFGASVQTLTADTSDVEKLIRLAAGTPVGGTGEPGNRWQEAGWWLVPVLALIVAVSFRRQTSNTEVAA